MNKFTYLLLFLSGNVSAQCLTVNSTPDTVVYATNNACDANLNFSQPVFQNTCQSIASDTFYFTGNSQQYIVPSGVTNVIIETWGAQGGANWVNNTNFGGYNSGDFTVAMGDVLSVFVGGQGSGTIGGFNGGGDGDGTGTGGGGATDVRLNGSTLTDRIIISGGGGGAGYWSGLHVVGGVGGGTNGGDGYRDTQVNMGGKGATSTGPGADGTCVNLNVTSLAGSLGIGGTPLSYNCGCEGYGGGGGYYGGAGSGNCRGGGGGSGYISPNASNTISTDGIRAGNGMVVISYSTGAPITTSQTAGLASGQNFPIGITTNTFLAIAGTDSLYSSFTVTVLDTIAPNFTGIIQNILTCEGVVQFSNPSYTDNCGASLSQINGPISGSSLSAGSYTVTYVVIDSSGNSDTTSFQITVNPPPSVQLTLNSSQNFVCVYTTSFVLNGESPAGGTWSGTGISGNTFNPNIAGLGMHEITYSYTDSNGCSSSAVDTITVDGCLGLDGIIQTEWTVYPNPANSEINLNLKDAGQLNIIDPTGKIVYSKRLNETNVKLNVSTFSNGFYSLQFKTDSGTTIIQQLVIRH